MIGGPLVAFLLSFSNYMSARYAKDKFGQKMWLRCIFILPITVFIICYFINKS